MSNDNFNDVNRHEDDILFEGISIKELHLLMHTSTMDAPVVAQTK